jgi:Domain of unknown function (DUF4410)
MRDPRRVPMSLFVVAVVAACAQTQTSDRKILVDEKIPRPDHIWVYDFAATPADVPADSRVAGQVAKDGPPQTAEQIALGREIGAELANALAAEITAMGLPAEHATSQTTPAVDDLVIRGTLLSVEAGSATERVAIGLGKGDAELKVAVEGYQMTDHGLRELGSGDLDTSASKTPGAAVPLVVAIATKNPLGLIVSTGVKLHGEETGSSTIHGKVQEIAKAIAAEARPRFEKQGWIPASVSAP